MINKMVAEPVYSFILVLLATNKNSWFFASRPKTYYSRP